MTRQPCASRNCGVALKNWGGECVNTRPAQKLGNWSPMPREQNRTSAPGSQARPRRKTYRAAPNRKRIPIHVGQVSSGRKKDGPPSSWPWYVWPEGENYILACMLGAVYGPFKSEAEAREATEGLWFERET
jgi:hypothetical protein